MLNLNGRATQDVRISGAKWSLVGPHPQADRRLIQRSNGTVRTVVAGRRLPFKLWRAWCFCGNH